MKRAVQALYVATSFPWGSASSTPSSSPTIRKPSLLAFLPASRSRQSNLYHYHHQRHITSSPLSVMKMSSNDKFKDTTVQQIENRIALLQLPVTSIKSQNIETANEYITKAYKSGASLCVLPEIWNSPYATSAFAEYAEVLPNVGDALPADLESSNNDGNSNEKDEEKSSREGCFPWGESSNFLMNMAQQTNMYIVGGSIPEIVSLSNNDYKIYNTCLIISPHGQVVGKHRKVHLFDIDVPGGICFKESDTLTGGEQGATYFDVDDGDDSLGRIGVGICYDIRFPEYALLLTQIHKCKILIYPGAFNLTTGPAHWELLQRARAVDGQCYVLSASPARMSPPKEEGKYPHYSAWGHSTVVSPWGEVVATTDEKPGIVIADLDMNKVNEMRMAIPTMVQKRHDLYKLVEGDSTKSK